MPNMDDVKNINSNRGVDNRQQHSIVLEFLERVFAAVIPNKEVRPDAGSLSNNKKFEEWDKNS